MPTPTGLWRLNIGGKRFLGLIPHDLTYFSEHFTGKVIPTPWSPPPAEVHGKSKKLPDFAIWMKGAPVVSERSRLVLEPLIGEAVQFLPFHQIKGKPYYALNVLALQHDLLDVEQSDLDRFSDGQIMSINRAVFRHPLPPSLPPIFKLREDTGSIFVSTAFASLVAEQQLTGAQFLSPSQDPFRLLLGREPLDAYSGTQPLDT